MILQRMVQNLSSATLCALSLEYPHSSPDKVSVMGNCNFEK